MVVVAVRNDSLLTTNTTATVSQVPRNARTLRMDGMECTRCYIAFAVISFTFVIIYFLLFPSLFLSLTLSHNFFDSFFVSSRCQFGDCRFVCGW